MGSHSVEASVMGRKVVVMGVGRRRGVQSQQAVHELSQKADARDETYEKMLREP